MSSLADVVNREVTIMQQRTRRIWLRICGWTIVRITRDTTPVTVVDESEVQAL